MSKTYRQAKCVFIWLGDHDQTTKEGIEMVKYVSDSALADPAHPSSASQVMPEFWLFTKPGLSVKETWETWLNIYRRQWYSRMWIMQEDRAPSDPIRRSQHLYRKRACPLEIDDIFDVPITVDKDVACM
jgi:hypothetical protein